MFADDDGGILITHAQLGVVLAMRETLRQLVQQIEADYPVKPGGGERYPPEVRVILQRAERLLALWA